MRRNLVLLMCDCLGCDGCGRWVRREDEREFPRVTDWGFGDIAANFAASEFFERACGGRVQVPTLHAYRGAYSEIRVLCRACAYERGALDRATGKTVPLSEQVPGAADWGQL